MRTGHLLDKLDAVRPRGQGRWVARCPAHPDKTPSLSVSEGARGVLVKCWAGCSVQEICSALDLGVHDLFFDDRRAHADPPVLSRQVKLDEVAFQFRLHATLLAIRAEETLAVAQGLNCSDWSDSEFQHAVEAVGRAYADLDWAALLEEVAFSLRCRTLDHEKAKHHAA